MFNSRSEEVILGVRMGSRTARVIRQCLCLKRASTEKTEVEVKHQDFAIQSNNNRTQFDAFTWIQNAYIIFTNTVFSTEYLPWANAQACHSRLKYVLLKAKSGNWNVICMLAHLLLYSCGDICRFMTWLKCFSQSSCSASVSQVNRKLRSGVTMVMPFCQAPLLWVLLGKPGLAL